MSSQTVEIAIALASAPAMSMGIVAESVVPWSICTVHPAAPAAADTVVLSPAILATAPTAVPATVPTAVSANVSTAVTATVSTAVPATVPAAVPAIAPTAVPATVPTDVPSCNADYGCRDHIFHASTESVGNSSQF